MLEKLLTYAYYTLKVALSIGGMAKGRIFTLLIALIKKQIKINVNGEIKPVIYAISKY
jgi:hypothetical protein